VTVGQTHCSWVHDTLFVDPRGDVFACAHRNPGIVGNIYENTLAEIYNGDRIREFRRQEIAGTLHCMERCTFWQSQVARNTVHADYHTDLKRLQIEFGEKCNIACIMCSQDHKSRLELDDRVVVDRVAIPKSCETIYVFGGEPLVLKSVKRFFDHCAREGSKLTFQTNGTAVTEEMARKIALHCRVINFSLNAASKDVHERINAGSNFEKVLRNVRRVIDAKRDLNGAASVWGHMTIVEENLHEIPAFIAKRQEFGFEHLDFGFDRKLSKFLAQNPAMKRQLAHDVGEAIKMSGNPHRVHAMRLRMLGLA
jgi:radical SAM protein with 4Fe4S-binding SPASM domain